MYSSDFFSASPARSTRAEPWSGGCPRSCLGLQEEPVRRRGDNLSPRVAHSIRIPARDSTTFETSASLRAAVGRCSTRERRSRARRRVGRRAGQKSYARVLLPAGSVPYSRPSAGVRRSIHSSASARESSLKGLPMRLSSRATPFSPLSSSARVLRRSIWLFLAFPDPPLPRRGAVCEVSSTGSGFVAARPFGAEPAGVSDLPCAPTTRGGG